MSETTVYLIDDEVEMLNLLEKAVELIDMKAVCYTNAIDFFQQEIEISSKSILTLDLHMPEMDGIEVMRRLANLDDSPALILMSGYDQGVLHSAEKLCYEHKLTVLASLTKPIVLKEFQQLIIDHSKKVLKSDSISISVKPKISFEELKTAIEQGQLILHYQPQIEIATGKLAGLEALIRWQHPVRGLLYPNEFIPLAEEQGLMRDLTHEVIRMVVDQENRWQEEIGSPEVSVNISAVDITSLTLPEQLADLLDEKKLSPSRLTLEVTESTLMTKLVKSLDILTRLRLKGIGLSIDDFGTGYSSLAQLHHMPFTELKIDQSFVSSMLEDSQAETIVKTCVKLGQELKMKVVAEGVETKEQLQFLRSLGCDVVQGFYFSKPLPAEKVSLILDKNWYHE